MCIVYVFIFPYEHSDEFQVGGIHPEDTKTYYRNKGISGTGLWKSIQMHLIISLLHKFLSTDIKLKLITAPSLPPVLYHLNLLFCIQGYVVNQGPICQMQRGLCYLYLLTSSARR